MQQVATYSFTISLAEVAAMYKGGFTSVTLAKPAYAPGESIRMIVRVWASTTARWVDIWWGSIIKAYDAAGRLLTQVAASHMAVPGVDDYETYDVDLDLGTQPAAGLSGYLELWCEGSPSVLVATMKFAVPGGAEEEKKVPWVAIAGVGAAVIVLAALSQKKA